jgi:hypothetical protein
MDNGLTHEGSALAPTELESELRREVFEPIAADD